MYLIFRKCKETNKLVEQNKPLFQAFHATSLAEESKHTCLKVSRWEQPFSRIKLLNTAQHEKPRKDKLFPAYGSILSSRIFTTHIQPCMYRHKRKGGKHPLVPSSCCSICQLIRNVNKVPILRHILLLFQGENRSLINTLSPMPAKSLIGFIYYISILPVMVCVLLGVFFREWLDFIWQSNATNGSRMYLLILKSEALGIPPQREF